MGSYDLVHVHSYTNFGPLAVYILKKLNLTKTKTVFTPHYHPQSTTEARETLRKIYDFILKKRKFSAFDTIIALTNFEKKFLSNFCDKQKIHVIPNGIDLEELNSVPEGLFRDKYGIGKTPYILYTGHLLKYKGLDTILFAIKRIIGTVKTDVKVVFVGDGPYRNYLQKMANDLGLGSCTIFTGFLDRKSLISAIKGCSIFVMPSSYEAFSISTAEAMACQKPVIVTKAGGLCELGVDNKFMIKYGDINGLSERIEYLLEHPAEATRFGWKYYLVTSRQYSWDRVAEEHHNLYVSISTRHGKQDDFC